MCDRRPCCPKEERGICDALNKSEVYAMRWIRATIRACSRPVQNQTLAWFPHDRHGECRVWIVRSRDWETLVKGRRHYQPRSLPRVGPKSQERNRKSRSRDCQKRNRRAIIHASLNIEIRALLSYAETRGNILTRYRKPGQDLKMLCGWHRLVESVAIKGVEINDMFRPQLLYSLLGA